MLQATFNQVDEYLEELEKDIASFSIRDNLIRVTNLYTPSKLSPNIRHVQVVSTFVSNGTIIRLSRYCGDTWGVNEEFDDKVYEKAKDAVSAIEDKAKQLKLDVRAGMYEEATIEVT